MDLPAAALALPEIGPGRKKGGLFYVNAEANSIERAVFLPDSQSGSRLFHGLSMSLGAVENDGLPVRLKSSKFGPCGHRPTNS